MMHVDVKTWIFIHTVSFLWTQSMFYLCRDLINMIFSRLVSFKQPKINVFRIFDNGSNKNQFFLSTFVNDWGKSKYSYVRLIFFQPSFFKFKQYISVVEGSCFLNYGKIAGKLKSRMRLSQLWTSRVISHISPKNPEKQSFSKATKLVASEALFQETL